MSTIVGRARRIFDRVWSAFDGLAADTLWSGAHDLAHLVTAMTSFILLQQVLELEQYGAYFGLYGLIGAFGAVSYSGVGLAFLQRLLGERDEPDPSLRSFLSLSVGIGAVAAFVVAVLAIVSLRLTPTEIVLVAIAELLAVAVVWIAAMGVQGVSGFPAAARIRMGVIAIRLTTVVSLYAAGVLSIRNLATGFCIGFALYALYLLRVHLPRHGYHVSFGRPTDASVRSSATFSIPMGASKLQTDADKYLLNVFRFEADAGLYGAAYRIVQLGTLPLLALDHAAFQRFLPQGEGEPGLHWRRATRLAGLIFAASTVVALALYLVLPYLDFLFEERYAEAIDIVPWLIVLIPLIATSGTPLNGLLGLGQADKRMLVYLSSAAVSIVLYLVLIPAYSWKGAVIATMISEVYLAVAGWTALRYYQKKADSEREDDRPDSVMAPA